MPPSLYSAYTAPFLTNAEKVESKRNLARSVLIFQDWCRQDGHCKLKRKYGKGRDGDGSIDLSRLLRYQRRKGKKRLLLRKE
jgi:hypothetical protein